MRFTVAAVRTLDRAIAETSHASSRQALQEARHQVAARAAVAGVRVPESFPPPVQRTRKAKRTAEAVGA